MKYAARYGKESVAEVAKPVKQLLMEEVKCN